VGYAKVDVEGSNPFSRSTKDGHLPRDRGVAVGSLGTFAKCLPNRSRCLEAAVPSRLSSRHGGVGDATRTATNR
jgi:hypothetical protein